MMGVTFQLNHPALQDAARNGDDTIRVDPIYMANFYGRGPVAAAVLADPNASFEAR